MFIESYSSLSKSSSPLKPLKTHKYQNLMPEVDFVSLVEQLAKRRGFFWQSAEIYGGLRGFYDYGPMGASLKRNFENIWRNYFLGLDENFWEIEGSQIMPQRVFEASGHLKNFNDPLCECKKCKGRFRADSLLEKSEEDLEGLTPEELTKLIIKHKIRCPNCKGELKEAQRFNLMFPINVQTTKETQEVAYLRPESAQTPYINFKQSFVTLRERLPLGLAVVGKAFRNEISPRNLLIRMKEFTQAELQIFFDPEKIDEHKEFEKLKKSTLRVLLAKERKSGEMELTLEDLHNKRHKLPKFYLVYAKKAQDFYLKILKIPKERFRLKELGEGERAFYNKYHFDIELDLPGVGWVEVGGVHYRTDHDLGGHQKVSGQSMEVMDIESKRKFVPHVLELSFGVDRSVFSILLLSFKKEKERDLLCFNPILSPIKVAVFPLVSKDGVDKKAEELYKVLLENPGLQGYKIFYDDGGSIGRRYRRQDEIGTPLCITVDYDTLKDGTVTVRERDSMEQTRVHISGLASYIVSYINKEV